MPRKAALWESKTLLIHLNNLYDVNIRKVMRILSSVLRPLKRTLIVAPLSNCRQCSTTVCTLGVVLGNHIHFSLNCDITLRENLTGRPVCPVSLYYRLQIILQCGLLMAFLSYKIYKHDCDPYNGISLFSHNLIRGCLIPGVGGLHSQPVYKFTLNKLVESKINPPLCLRN